MTQQIVTLRTVEGYALHCIWHAPEKRLHDVACVLLSPGVKMRVAPHRLYRKLTKTFLERGIGVLRVDFHGLGDSEGELPESKLDQVYRKVQEGRHVPDVRVALDWLEREQRIAKVIVGGLCGGAITGLLASENDSRVVGLYAIGIPVTYDGPADESAAHMTRGELAGLRSTYLRKLADPASWMRLLRLKSDFKLIWRALAAGIGYRRKQSSASNVSADTPAPSTALAANFNEGFARAFFRLLRRRTRALLIFSGSDRLFFEFDEKFREPWAAQLEQWSEYFDVKVVPEANHILGDPAWVATAQGYTAAWLERYYT